MEVKYIDSKRIQKFVTMIEDKKGFSRDADLIVRHLFEEIGELSRILWLYKSNLILSHTGDKPEYAPHTPKDFVARELVDMICLTNYIADVLEIDLDAYFPRRAREVAFQYGAYTKEMEDGL